MKKSLDLAKELPETLPVTYEYHHIGIPTENIQPDEKYSPLFNMYIHKPNQNAGLIC